MKTLSAALSILLLATASDAATVDGLKIHTTVSGKEPATVFLVHGYTCDETTWTEQVPALAKQFRVVTLDLPGAAADVSAAGMIVYAPSAAVRRLVWVSRTGVEEPVIDETRGYLNPGCHPTAPGSSCRRVGSGFSTCGGERSNCCRRRTRRATRLQPGCPMDAT